MTVLAAEQRFDGDKAALPSLQARLAWGARTWAVLLLLAAAAMSVARYVG